jgi:hypothetical protein
VILITLQRVQTIDPIATRMSWLAIEGKTYSPSICRGLSIERQKIDLGTFGALYVWHEHDGND